MTGGGPGARQHAALDPRSLLFVPGSRPDMIAKAVRCGADAVAVDLEDAVAPAGKVAARTAAMAAVAALDVAPATAVLIRVNPAGSPWFADDVEAAAASPARGVVLPKLSRSSDLDALSDLLTPRGRRDLEVVVGIETALGVADARELLAGAAEQDRGAGARAGAVYFGAEDFIADMGGGRTVAGAEVHYARSRVCLAARLAGVPAIDQAVVTVADDERFLAECQEAAALGYTGKICIHPRQVTLANRAFTPGEPELAHARAVIEAAAGGVGVVDGEMVDAAHVRAAERVLARSRQARKVAAP
ncbi:MAG: HpcH/HpaI aldolase/citrate lyase family protein [Acidimicrobiales bacterium]